MNSQLIYRTIFISTIAAFILSGYALEQFGIKYVSEGGTKIFKIHLYSYLIGLLFLYNVLRYDYNSIALGMGRLYDVWRISVILLLCVIAYGLFKHGTSGMAYLIDTFFSPLILLPLLCKLNKDQLENLVQLIAVIILFNCMAALIEYGLKLKIWHGDHEPFGYFRSSAFLAHPLTNALITVAVAPVLINKTKIPSGIYFISVFLALFAFGGRAALSIFLLSILILSIPTTWRFLTSGVAMSKLKFSLFLLLSYLCLILFLYVVLETGITDRIMNTLYIDGSASARFDVFYLLEQLTPWEWFFGASANLRSAIDLYLGITVIENYLIGLIFTFGLLGTIPLFISYTLPLAFFFIKGKLVQKVAIFAFFVTSLSNNSLSVKTPTLLFLYLLLTCVFLLDKTVKNDNCFYENL